MFANFDCLQMTVLVGSFDLKLTVVHFMDLNCGTLIVIV